MEFSRKMTFVDAASADVDAIEADIAGSVMAMKTVTSITLSGDRLEICFAGFLTAADEDLLVAIINANL